MWQRRERRQILQEIRDSGRRFYWKKTGSAPGVHDFQAAAWADANLVGSLTENGRHRPILDLDVPVYLVASSTPGRSHLYIEVDVPLEGNQEILDVLAKWGIVNPGYAELTRERGLSLVRKAGHIKGGEPVPAVKVPVTATTGTWGEGT